MQPEGQLKANKFYRGRYLTDKLSAGVGRRAEGQMTRAQGGGAEGPGAGPRGGRRAADKARPCGGHGAAVHQVHYSIRSRQSAPRSGLTHTD